MTTRAQAAENALASVRAEGLDPGVAEELLDRWASGEISDAQLDEAARRIGAGESLAELHTAREGSDAHRDNPADSTTVDPDTHCARE